jgi:glycosyltransferase involved in cell wall biosynthesis
VIKKKIIIDGSSLIKKRGVGTYVASLISGLAKIKISSDTLIIVMVPLSCKFDFVSKKHIKIIKKPFINKIIWDLILLPFYCWREGGCLLHYTENTGGSLFSKLFKIKLALTIHDVSFLKPFQLVARPSSFRQWIGLYYRRWCVNNIAKNSKIIFTVSKFAKKDIIKELSVFYKKIIVTPNSLSSKFALPRTFPQEKKIIIIAGLSNQKNLDFTLQCMKRSKDILKGWKIIVVGVSGENSKYINYVGEVDRDNLISYYDKASILIMPSLYESFSIPLIEALSRGLFVISSNKGAPPEILKKFGLLYNPKSCQQLRKNLIKALHKNRFKSQLNKKRAMRYALSFTDKKLAQETLGAYKKLLK